jgi:hypothetical protein
MKRAFQMLALVVASTAMLSGAAAAQQQTAPDNTKRNKTEATTAELARMREIIVGRAANKQFVGLNVGDGSDFGGRNV